MYVPLASQSPYPIIAYAVANIIIDRILVTLGQMGNIHDPNSVAFYFYWPIFRLNEEHFTFHLQYKHSGTFANRKYEELSYPKKSENVRPHSSNSIENVTPL